jgi:hypothetical protein
MIVKIKIKSSSDTFTMLFGNSYKNWTEQFREYCYAFKPIEVLEVETSKEDWKGWGGLKWCNEDEFQEELNREGCQSSDPDNPNPRIYKNMRFSSNRIVENTANKIAKRYF